MRGRFPLFVTLATAGAMAHAHENLELDGAYHRLLHAVGTENLLALGGTALAIAVAVVVRGEARKARARRGHQG